MEKYEIILTAADEYSSPSWLHFNSPRRYIRAAEEGEYSITVLAENSYECRQMLDDWFLKGQIYGDNYGKI